MGPRAVLFPLEQRQISVLSRESNHDCSVVQPVGSTVKACAELSERHNNDTVTVCWLRCYCKRRQTQAMGNARASQRGYTERSLFGLRQHCFCQGSRLPPFVLLVTAACRGRRLRRIGGFILTGENRSTGIKTCPRATLSIINLT